MTTTENPTTELADPTTWLNSNVISREANEDAQAATVRLAQVIADHAELFAEVRRLSDYLDAALDGLPTEAWEAVFRSTFFGPLLDLRGGLGDCLDTDDADKARREADAALAVSHAHVVLAYPTDVGTAATARFIAHQAQAATLGAE